MTEFSSRTDPHPVHRTVSEVELAFREREIAVKEREQATREAELELKRRDRAASGWRSPLVVAVFAAAIGASGNAVVTYVNGALQRDLEAQRSEQARLLEMIKTGDPDKAATNLKFLLDAGLVNDERQASRLRHFLATREPGSGPVLPSQGPAGPYTGGIIGIDDAISTNQLPPDSPILGAAQAVGQLRTVNRSFGAAVCTAFLVSPQTIITASFCADDIESAAFALNQGGKESTIPVKLPPVEKAGNADGLNYAVLELNSPVRFVRPLRLSTRVPLTNEKLALVMFRDTHKQLTVVGTADCRVVAIQPDFFYHRCDSGSGSSGAPMLSADGTNVLGIHFRRDEQGGVATRADRVLASSRYLRTLNPR